MNGIGPGVGSFQSMKRLSSVCGSRKSSLRHRGVAPSVPSSSALCPFALFFFFFNLFMASNLILAQDNIISEESNLFILCKTWIHKLKPSRSAIDTPSFRRLWSNTAHEQLCRFVLRRSAVHEIISCVLV